MIARLSRGWYADRLDPDFAPKTVPELQRVLTDAGLDGPFWRLT